MGKIIGAILVFFSCLYCVYIKIRERKQRLCNLGEMERALFYLKHEIAFSNRTLQEVCDGLASCLDGQVGDLFYKIGKLLHEDHTCTFQEAWDTYAKCLFSTDAAILLRGFSASLGKGSKEQEAQAIERYMEHVRQQYKEEKTCYMGKRKLTYTLCIGGALAVVVLVV